MLNVDKSVEWFQDNHMKVNPDKFQCIFLGKVVNPGTFLINGNSELYQNTKLAECIQFYLPTRSHDPADMVNGEKNGG